MGTLTFSGDTLPNAQDLYGIGHGFFSDYQFKPGKTGNKYGYNKSDFYYFFGGNSVFTSVDLTSLDFSKVTNASRLFDGCSNLRTIYSNEETDNFLSILDDEHSDMMFYSCAKLQGQNGSTVEAVNIIIRYTDNRAYTAQFAKLDNWDGVRDESKLKDMGYFTDIKNKNEHVITIENEGYLGKVESDFRAANEGTPITLKATLSTGYSLKDFTTVPEELEITPVEGKPNTYTFRMPNEDVTIKPEFEQGVGKAIVFNDGTEDTYMEFLFDSDERIKKNFVIGEAAKETKYQQYGKVSKIYDIPYTVNDNPSQPTNLPQ